MCRPLLQLVLRTFGSIMVERYGAIQLKDNLEKKNGVAPNKETQSTVARWGNGGYLGSMRLMSNIVRLTGKD